VTKRILTFKELREHGISFSRRHINRLEVAGKFPKRVWIGERTPGWLAAEIDAWVEAKIKERGRA
jgi:prophage regulatory protein